ncbi:sulfur oxidation c-type cytochrome SoxA [Cognatishimia sp. F0-27]|uniref:sulfur oxidation c-type cytochrome SoxA n=1 Tax=Cognatishimia sp. F0-27 TaxID=2816855 RepID=UPI001D0C3477|nr:sulfur oxidation c-type cytochrome SoxA [Cognatishimia sp. F0-27]MCC1491750.1 sulfur oxidation c-type cytochrome SoxA [Cognatishimia sp. F0-27]
MKFKALTATAALLAATTVYAGGADDDTLVINGEIEMTTKVAAPPHMADTGISELISGWHFRSDETQQLQTDDFENQGMIFVDQALEAWETAEGTEGKSCASCHESPDSMAGVAATYPKWNEEAGELRTVQMQMNDCRTNRMGAEAWKYDAAAAINMESMIASQSRGMPVNVAIDGPAAEAWEMGKELYYTRTGQLELSCASCHEENYGNYIRADHLSQGQINGFPTYRLKNAKLNGVHSRFRGCVRDTRAETYSTGSPEFVALELYVKSRGNGLSVEGPSVRN